MHLNIFRSNYIFNNDAHFFRFLRTKFLLIFLTLKLFQHQQALPFGILNYEKQLQDVTCKFWEDLFYFQHFMQIFDFA